MCRQSLKSLQVLASALGRKHGIRVELTTKGTAFTNGRVIYLPLVGRVIDERTRTLTRGYIDHEAAHVRWSVIPDKATALFNILEDVRVEKLMMEQYPGSAKNLEDLIFEVRKDGAFPCPEPDWPDKAVAGSYIVSMLRVTVLHQMVLQRVMSEARAMCVERFGEAKVNALDAYLSDFSPASTQDCLRMHDEILALLFGGQGEKAKNIDDPQGDGPGGLSPEEGSSRPGSDAQGDGPGGSSPEEGPNGAGSDAQGDGPGGLSPEENDPGDNLLRRYDVGAKLSDMLTSLGKDINSMEYFPLIERAGEKPVNVQPEFLREAELIGAQLRNVLVDHLQTIGLVRNRTTRQGLTLVSRKIARVATGDSRIFRNSSLAKKVNATVHIVLDRSESMADRIWFKNHLVPMYLVADMITLALLKAALPMPQIKLEVVCFPVPGMDDEYIHIMHPIGRRHLSSLAPLFSAPGGGTPLHVPLRYLRDHIALAAEEDAIARHIVLVVTDGEPNEDWLVFEAVSKLRESGVDVYCFGLPGVGRDFIRRCFKPRYSRMVTRMESLPKYLGDLLLTRVLV